MLYRHLRPRRSGAHAMEFAFICPLLLFVLVVLGIGGMGIFRYQEVAWLARKAARYSCVLGSQYHTEMTNPSPTEDQIRQAMLNNWAVALDPARVTLQASLVQNG